MDSRERKYYNNRNDRMFYRVYDENEKFVTKILKEEAKNLNPKYYLHGVTCFVMRKNANGEWDVLLEVRANTELTPGKIDLVSGHLDGSETPTQAMIRELREEVGIENVDYTQIHKLSQESKPLGFESRGKVNNFFINFYCFICNNTRFKIQRDEVAALRWVPMKKAFDMIRTGRTKFPKQEGQVDYEEIFNNIIHLTRDRNIQEKKVISE